MKRILILAAFLMGLEASAQFKAGLNAGIPSGDFADYYSLSFGVDLYYLFDDPDAFLNFGATAGFLNYTSEDLSINNVKVEAAQFIPLAASARVTLLSFLTIGPDIGYALGLNDNNDGGFYWKGIVGLDFANTIEIDLFYSSVSFQQIAGAESKPLGSLGIGLLYTFHN